MLANSLRHATRVLNTHALLIQRGHERPEIFPYETDDRPVTTLPNTHWRRSDQRTGTLLPVARIRLRQLLSCATSGVRGARSERADEFFGKDLRLFCEVTSTRPIDFFCGLRGLVDE